MDMTSLAAALESAKILAGVAKATSAAAVDHQVKQRLVEIQQGIIDVQTQLVAATHERLDLLHQLAELRSKVMEFETAKAALDGYELCEIAEGRFLYRSKPEADHSVPHHACPACHNAGKVSVLQSAKTGKAQTLYSCAAAACSFRMYVGPSDPKPPVMLRSARWTG